MRARRRDGNHRDMIEYISDNGYGGLDCNEVLPFDYLVTYRDTPLLLPLEFKVRNGRVRPSQARFFVNHPDLIVSEPFEALQAIVRYR